MSIHVGDTVVVLRDIYRVSRVPSKFVNLWSPNITELKQVLYAAEGDTGVVLQIFTSHIGAEKTAQAQVRMHDDEIKTFRLTSLMEVRDRTQNTMEQYRTNHLPTHIQQKARRR